MGRQRSGTGSCSHLSPGAQSFAEEKLDFRKCLIRREVSKPERINEEHPEETVKFLKSKSRFQGL